MKKLYTLLFCFFLLISASACKGTQANQKPSETMDLNTFLQTVKLPKNLSVSFDAAKVKSIASAKTYTVDVLELNPDTVAAGLLRKKIVDTKPQAVGPWYQTGDKSLTEYLTVLDGGKSFGKQVDVNGGLYYGVFINGKPDLDLSSVISGEAGPPSISEQLHKSLSRTDYASFTNLPFMNYVDALAAVENQLYALGFPKLEVAEAYSIDLQTMRQHYALYAEENRNSNQEKPDEINWSEENERYLFHFRQLIDSIPVFNGSWEWGKGTATSASGNLMKYPSISVAYSKNGMTNIQAGGLYDVAAAKSSEEKPLISVVEALQVMFDEYAELLLDKGTRVASAELVYVSIPAGNVYEMVPAWVFEIAKPSIWEDPESKSELPFDTYSRYVVNAMTGEKLSGTR